MTRDPRIERALPRILEDLGAGPAPDYTDTILARTASMPQRPGWTFPERWFPMASSTGRVATAPRLAWRTLVVLALLLLALAAGVAIVGSQQRRLPAVVGPAGNGLIAYSNAGDIFVGDPRTGTTTSIVTGPANDFAPIFSPHGSRILFLRGTRYGDAAIVVVRADGSEERVVMPQGFSKRFLGSVAWTPDGASIAVNHDGRPRVTPYFDGRLSVFDATGAAAPRLLTPPLPAWPGAPYFIPNGPVAPMFRPPAGDRILSYRIDEVTEHDVDGRLLREIVGSVLQDLGLRWVGMLAWSPDASKIAFVGQETGEGQRWIFVLNADGGDVRRLVAGDSIAWSPDGTRIAVERYLATSANADRAVIAIVDVASGTERVLEATRVDQKHEGGRPTGTSVPCCKTSPTFRSWFYEGWSWSPDGRSLLLLERHGTRPVVIDLESGRVTELPWEADSAPSWQRVAT